MAYGVRVVFPQTPSMLAVVGTVPTVAVVPPKQRGVLLTLYNSTPAAVRLTNTTSAHEP
jgi:hypothetical protein